MIITIQPLKKGYEIIKSEVLVFPSFSQFEITKVASILAELIFKQTGVRPTIKILPIQHTPMAMKKEINIKNNPYEFGFMKGYEAGRESYRIQMQLEDVTNYNQPMAMTKTYPAKKKAVVAKKKVVKKAGKK